jgi:hypothetical protein
MRIFVYKILIFVLSMFLLYQFTIGYSIYSFQQKISSNFNKETTDKFKSKIREELSAGIKKEKILNDDDALLLRNFYNKIKSEFNNIK